MIFNKLEKKGIANRRKLYQSFVENLPIKNKQYFVCDTEVIGLRVVINATGVKTFYLQRYNKKTKFSARYKIGTFPECSVHMAREISRNVKAKSVQGQDPAFTLKETEAAKTCGDVMKEFLDKRYSIYSKTKKKSTIYSVRASLEAWFFGNSNDPEINKIWKQHNEVLNIKNLELSQVTTETILDFHQAITLKAPYNANRVVAYIREMFNYAISKSYLDGDNPASISKKKLFKESKDHFDYYAPKLVPKMLDDLDAEMKFFKNTIAAAATKAELLCGGRYKSEVNNLTIDQIDLDNKKIIYGDTKTGQKIRPINDEMVNFIKWIYEQRSKGKKPFYYPPEDMRHKYLFPNFKYGSNIRTKRGVKPIKLKHLGSQSNFWKIFCKKYGYEVRDLKSLRHTFAVFMVHKAVPLRVLQKMMLHESITTTEIYAALDEQTIQNEMSKISFSVA
jgi:integrase